MTKFGLKALSFRLEFIDKTGEKVFCLLMQINICYVIIVICSSYMTTSPVNLDIS